MSGQNKSGPLFRNAPVNKNLSIVPPVRIPAGINRKQQQSIIKKDTLSSSVSLPVSSVPSSSSPKTLLSEVVQVSTGDRRGGDISVLEAREIIDLSSLKKNTKSISTTSTSDSISTTENDGVGMISVHSAVSPRSTTSVISTTSSGTHKEGDAWNDSSPSLKPSVSTLEGRASTARFSTRRSGGRGSKTLASSQSGGATAGSARRQQPLSSEMKPKLLRNSTSRSRSGEGLASMDLEEFWESQDAQWKSLNVSSTLEVLREALQEQVDGFKEYLQMKERQSEGGPHCLRSRAGLPAPAPLEAVKWGTTASTFAYQLARRGSADEVFWKNVLKNKESLEQAGLTTREEVATSSSSTLSSVHGAVSTSSTDTDGESLEEGRDEQKKSEAINRNLQDLAVSNIAVLKQNNFIFSKNFPLFGNSRDNLGLKNVRSKHKPDEASSQQSSFDASVLRSRALGKRGRLYDEIWDEDAYLKKKAFLIESYNEKCKVTGSVPFRTEVVENWSQLLGSYSDDHDGFYYDWLTDKLHSEYKANLYKKEEDRVKRVDMTISAPPVPVSCHHPACWGLHPRSSPPGLVKPASGVLHGRHNIRRTSTLDVTQFHPAAYRSSIVIPKRTLDDIDDISLKLDMDVDELARQSAANFVILSQLISSVGLEGSLQTLRDERQRLEIVTKKISDIFVRNNLDTQNAATALCFHHGIISSGPDDVQSRNTVADENVDVLQGDSLPLAPPAAVTSLDITSRLEKFFRSSDLSQSKKTEIQNEFLELKTKLFQKRKIVLDQNKNEIHYLPSMFRERNFLQDLEVGDLVEVNELEGVWSLKYVVELKKDAVNNTRCIQCQAAGGCYSDVQWVCVEDDSIAPPGTHVPQFIVDHVSHSRASSEL